jgi:hypothetical protein
MLGEFQSRGVFPVIRVQDESSIPLPPDIMSACIGFVYIPL